MKEIIYRQDALDAINRCRDDYDLARQEQIDDCENAVREIQPAKTVIPVPFTIESAIEYLRSYGWLQAHDRALTEDVFKEVGIAIRAKMNNLCNEYRHDEAMELEAAYNTLNKYFEDMFMWEDEKSGEIRNAAVFVKMKEGGETE